MSMVLACHIQGLVFVGLSPLGGPLCARMSDERAACILNSFLEQMLGDKVFCVRGHEVL